MSLWQSFKRLLNPADTVLDETFSMGNRGEKPPSEDLAPKLLENTQVRTDGVLTHIDSLLEAAPKGKDALKKVGDLTQSLDQNIDRLKAVFRLPVNKDLIIRELQIATQPPTRAVVCFMEGLSDKMIINGHILEPLMLLSHLDHHLGDQGEEGKTAFSVKVVMNRLLPGHQIKEQYEMKQIAISLLAGDTAVFFENERVALTVETKSPPGRSVGEPKTEQVIQGAKDAFVEAWRVNVALVRRRLKDPSVVTEILTIGQLSNNYVGLMYVDGLVSPKLVAEVKRRIEAVKVDVMNGAGTLEQFIEDAPGSLLPGVLTTERPDRAAAYLSEGHVAIFVDNSPFAMIAPITFWSLLQTAEDYYLRFPFASFLRYIRLVALLIAMIVPAAYVAIINYHHEMIPTELMLFVAQSRERVPLPAVAELILMDLSFELIREAGTRIPSVIGPTMGLVASLVLGQAAVEAKIVSPIMILIVALTGLASFAIPTYLTGYGIRALRFLLVASSACLGFYGMGTVLFMLIIYLSGMRSFGIPYLSPIAPNRGAVSDVFNRQLLFEMEFRPSYTRSLNKRRQKEIIRSWDPFANKPGVGNDEGGSS